MQDYTYTYCKIAKKLWASFFATQHMRNCDLTENKNIKPKPSLTRGQAKRREQIWFIGVVKGYIYWNSSFINSSSLSKRAHIKVHLADWHPQGTGCSVSAGSRTSTSIE